MFATSSAATTDYARIDLTTEDVRYIFFIGLLYTEGVMISTENRLRAVGRQCLNKAGRDQLEEHLALGNIERARIYLLGAVDSLWFEKELSNEEARVLYVEIGMPPEESAQLRQRNLVHQSHQSSEEM